MTVQKPFCSLYFNVNICSLLSSFSHVYCTVIVRNLLLQFFAKTAKATHPNPHLPISDPAGAQQDFCISAPFPLQHDIYIHRLIVYEDLLHAAMKARQLGHTASRVIGFRTTCSTTDMKLSIFNLFVFCYAIARQ